MSFHRRNGGRIGDVITSPIGVIDNQLVQVYAGSLYSFTSFTFTNAGATGRNGPTLANCLATYNTATYPWLSNTAYFNMITQGIQLWTVPTTGTYRITAIGAKGASVSATVLGGNGARMIGDFTFSTGTVLAILVGQQGTQTPVSTGNKGGGGGSFVWQYSSGVNGLLIAAGGGGGSQGTTNGVAASITTSGTLQGNAGGTAGINGNGTTNGAGWYSNGTLYLTGSAAYGSVVAFSPTNGGVGGDGYLADTPHAGGFGGGGGGGGSPASTAAGGGGGGYSGGAGGTNSVSSGGGGGSYNGGSNQSNTAGIGTGMGSVTITKI